MELQQTYIRNCNSDSIKAECKKFFDKFRSYCCYCCCAYAYVDSVRLPSSSFCRLSCALGVCLCVCVDVCLPVCLCMLPLCCTKLHLILRFLLCVCVFKLVVYVTFSACCCVVAAFRAVHGLHLNKPVAAYVGVCVWKCWCVLA